MNNWIGQKLGNYSIEKHLGQGGSGHVFKALDTRLNRHVAIKILDPSLSANTQFVEAFRKAAAASADLHHQGIVTVHDIGEQNGVHYLVMAYLRGVTLDVWLQKNRKMTMRQVARIARQLGDALDYAHNKGVIHCDIKSSNIMLGRDGRVTILDFGLARARTLGRSATTTGASLAYMSPEQALNRPLDVRTDVYSMGIVLYELLTGEVPFRRAEPSAVVYAHVRETPRPINSLPASVSRVILKALEKSPDRRYSSTGELATDFERAVKESLVFPQPYALALLGAAGLVAVLFLIVLMNRPPPPPPPPASPSLTSTALPETVTPTHTAAKTPATPTVRPVTETPTPRLTATLAPTATPTNTPAAMLTPTSEPATPTAAAPSELPAPRILTPATGSTILGRVSFAWTYDGPPLQENQGFEVRIWNDSSTEHQGAVAPVSTTSTTINIEQITVVRQHGSGPYYWSVAVIQINPYQKIGQESAPTRIMVQVGGS